MDDIRDIQHTAAQGPFNGGGKGRVRTAAAPFMAITTSGGGGAGPVSIPGDTTTRPPAMILPSIRPEVTRPPSVGALSREGSVVSSDMNTAKGGATRVAPTDDDDDSYAEQLMALERDNGRLRTRLRDLEVEVKDLRQQSSIAVDRARAAKARHIRTCIRTIICLKLDMSYILSS